jgi:hypothetical protein
MRLLLDGSPVSAGGYLLRGQGSRTRKAQAQAGEGGMRVQDDGSVTADASDHTNPWDAYQKGRQAEREAVVAFMREAVVTGYPPPTDDGSQCSHGNFRRQDCIACYDDFLSARLDAVEAGSHLKGNEG